MHDGQLAISELTVRRLIAEQFPQWRELPVRRIHANGTVNAIFRIGQQLAARFRLEPADVTATRQRLAAEAAAMDALLRHTRFRTPEPVAIGEPGAGYPQPWSVQTWLPGTVATDTDPGASTSFAADLAEFVGAVRTIGTGGATFHGDGRGGVLADHDTWMDTCLRNSVGLLDVDRLRHLWQDMRQLPRGSSPDVTNHRDLIPGNVLVARGRLAGVLDCGDLAAADPALDLVAAWHLLEEGPRTVFREALGCTDAEWARGQAWAFEQAMGLVWYYVDSNPTMSELGRRTLRRILDDG